MRIATKIHAKLSAALQPLRLQIIDESARHAGHAGARPGAESHFRVEIVSAAFTGKTRLDRQRMVYDTLREELAQDIHALSLRTQSPEEGETKNRDFEETR